MKSRQIGWVIGGWIGFFFLWTNIVSAQTGGDIQLQIRLRYSDGTAVSGEPVILQRLPEADPITLECETNSNGECSWYVGRGLYQVLFERPLDNISALAVAEGGLHGFGVTVGDEGIVYHFTFHSDGRVYFDEAPEAAVPSPLIPTGDMLHGGIAPTPTVEDESITETPTPTSEPTRMLDTAVSPTSNSFWRIILFIGGGLAIGGGLHFWARQRQTGNRQSSIKNRKSEADDA